MVEVTEADKAALQAYLTERHRRAFAGSKEPHAELFLETLARHRIAAENAALERAAKVAEKWIEPVMATPHENATYRSIAAAIRALKGPFNA